MISLVLMTEVQNISWSAYKALAYTVKTGVTNCGLADVFGLCGKVLVAKEGAVGRPLCEEVGAALCWTQIVPASANRPTAGHS